MDDDGKYGAKDPMCVALWLLATRKQGRDWLDTEARLTTALPGMEFAVLDEALRFAGEVLDGERSFGWGTC